MKRILVGLDTSPRAPEVLNQAVSMATKLGARLVLVRAVGVPVEVPVEAYRLSPDSLTELLRTSAQKDLDALAGTAPSGIVERSIAVVGVPWQVVCESARQHGADLIMIGSHGYGLLDRLLGTTAARIVNHADRSVLIVRPAPPAAT